MNKLKTLEDWYYNQCECNSTNCCANSMVDPDELKEEAINWLKAEIEFFSQKGRVPSEITAEMEMVYHARTWIMHFFNINHGDLTLKSKNEKETNK